MSDIQSCHTNRAAAESGSIRGRGFSVSLVPSTIVSFFENGIVDCLLVVRDGGFMWTDV